MGISMVAHAIIAFGTPSRGLLPRILTGEVFFFCQGYPSRESGSDLASLMMAAVDDGDHLSAPAARSGPPTPPRPTGSSALVRTTRGARKQQASPSC